MCGLGISREMPLSSREPSFSPLVYLADRYTEIPKDRKIVITDWAMKQSSVASKFLTVKGYTIVGVLKGGIERWKSENLPVEEREPAKKPDSLSIQKKK